MFTEIFQLKSKHALLLSVGIIIILTSALFVYVNTVGIDNEFNEDIEVRLLSNIESTEIAIDNWYSGKFKEASLVASRDTVVLVTEKLLSIKGRSNLISSDVQKILRKKLTPIINKYGYMGYFIISPDYINLASMRDSNIGEYNLLAGEKSFFKTIFSGKSELSKPVFSDVPLPDKSGKVTSHVPTMFVGTPIYDKNKNVIAALTIRLNPLSLYSEVTNLGRIGRTGETYMFNHEGVLITESRFTKTLIDSGFLIDGQTSILSAKLINPNVDLTKNRIEEPFNEDSYSYPYTLMALSALKGDSGVNLEGYKNYLGVDVVGAWKWNGKHNYGIASEIAVDEAFKSYYNIVTITIIAFLVAIVFYIVLVYLLVKQNIKAREDAEARLKDSEGQVRLLLDSTAEAIYGVNLYGECTFANPSCLRMLGYDNDEEILGRNMHNLIHHTKADGTPFPKHECFLSDTPEELEGYHSADEVLWRKDGTSFPAEYWAHPMKSQGRTTGSVITFLDITERKASEGIVLKSQKLESLGVLAGGISHDFNNLLTIMLGSVSTVKTMFKPGEKNFKYLENCENAAKRASDLTRQLITFSKGAAPIKKVFSLEKLIKETVNLALSGSAIESELNLQSNLKAVNADEGQINQVVSNLLINAVQSMPDGGTIKISSENIYVDGDKKGELARGGYIKTTIKDSGMGMTSHLMERIFDPYYTTKKKGSGLGLASSFSIMKQHGGAITVDSTVGRGSSFTLYLPSVDEEVEEKSLLDNVVMKGHGRILVLDDESSIGMILESMLLEYNYEPVITVKGEETLEKYIKAFDSESPYRAVILDLTIKGGMGGLDTMKKLREFDSGVKVIVSSGYSKDFVMSNYKDYGFTASVPKPYRSNELLKVLRTVVDL